MGRDMNLIFARKAPGHNDKQPSFWANCKGTSLTAGLSNLPVAMLGPSRVAPPSRNP